MAICLAEMHWDVKIDAADVDFVLGTAPEKNGFPSQPSWQNSLLELILRAV